MQDYGKVFAEVYNRWWTGFPQTAAKTLLPYFTAHLDSWGLESSLLEVCCGTGQFSSRFLQTGFRVTGIDLSESMLFWARENNRSYIDAGMATYLHRDARDFEVPGSYSLAVSVFDALNHLPDPPSLQSCFSCVYRSLVPNGLFVFDLNTRKGLERWNGITINEEPEVTVIGRGVFSPEMDRAYTKLSGYLRRPGGMYERFSEVMFNTAFAMEDIRRMLIDAGFSAVRASNLENFGAAVPDPELQDRVFFIASR